jgi:molybdate transport system regulatory protein
MARLTLRLDLGPEQAIGPGKIRLLEAVRDTGSISEAGRSLSMSYRRAWLLVDDMNRCFRDPVVTTKLGGRRGGGAVLTAFGRRLVESYREIERQAHAATAKRLHQIELALRAPAKRRPAGSSSRRGKTA